MRFVAGIFGLLGALGALFLGFKWYSDLNSEEGKLAQSLAGAAGEVGAEFSGLANATYALIACGVIGLAVSVMVFARKGNRMANGVILILCGVVPLIFASKALFGVPMVLGGLLAFAVKPTPQPGTMPA